MAISGDNKIKTMKQIKLVKPKLEDLWFRADCLSDPETMNYNAGYNVTYDGYNYNTGCIEFNKENWEPWYNTKLSNPNFYYAYILDEQTNHFVGYVNFNMDEKSKQATMGIVVKHEFNGQGYMRPAMQQLILKAKQMGVKALTDTVPETRVKALKVFYDLGFKKVGEFETTKFNKPEIVAVIILEL